MRVLASHLLRRTNRTLANTSAWRRIRGGKRTGQSLYMVILLIYIQHSHFFVHKPGCNILLEILQNIFKFMLHLLLCTYILIVDHLIINVPGISEVELSSCARTQNSPHLLLHLANIYPALGNQLFLHLATNCSCTRQPRAFTLPNYLLLYLTRPAPIRGSRLLLS